MTELYELEQLCTVGDLSSLKTVPIPDKYINRLFYVAAKYGQRDVLELFLDKKPDVHDSNDRAFCAAASNGHCEVLDLLVSLENTHGYFNMCDSGAFYMTAVNGRCDILRFLNGLEATHGETDIHYKQETAFRWAAANGHCDTLELLLQMEPTHGQIDIHTKNEYAFSLACYNGHHDVMNLLIREEPTHGQINIHVGKDDIFRSAVENGDLKAVDMLLRLEPTHGMINIHNGSDLCHHRMVVNETIMRGDSIMLRKLLTLESSHEMLSIRGQETIYAIYSALNSRCTDVIEILFDMPHNRRIRMDLPEVRNKFASSIVPELMKMWAKVMLTRFFVRGIKHNNSVRYTSVMDELVHMCPGILKCRLSGFCGTEYITGLESFESAKLAQTDHV